MTPSTAPGAPRRRLTKPQRRARILDAADALFGADDYRAVTVERVAETAGISTPVFYDHFASKSALYRELLVGHGERLVAATTRVAEAATLAEVLHANVAAFFGFVEEHPGAWRMLFRDAPSDPDLEALHRQIQDAATTRLSETIVARAGRVRLSADVADEQASVILAELGKSALNGLAAWWWTHREVDRATVVAVAYDLLWHGVSGLTGAPPTDQETTRRGRSSSPQPRGRSPIQ